MNISLNLHMIKMYIGLLVFSLSINLLITVRLAEELMINWTFNFETRTVGGIQWSSMNLINSLSQ